MVLGWPEQAPANAPAYHYELRDLGGYALRQGACTTGKVTLVNVPAGIYLLVTTGPNGHRNTQRLEVR